jgi:hypothetical protein
MNCLEFRRELLANPGATGAEAQEHALGCAACADFRARTLALDAEIAELLDVPVPEGLEERVLEAHRTGRRDSRRRFLAMAASVAGVTVVGSGVFVAMRDDPAALAGIDFVIEEEANAILTAKAPQPQDLVRVSLALGLELPPQLGDIRYIGTCPFRGSIAHHLIVTTPQGKATLLLLPELPAQRRGTATSRGLRALVKPAGRGSATVVAESTQGLERIEGMVWRS